MIRILWLTGPLGPLDDAYIQLEKEIAKAKGVILYGKNTKERDAYKAYKETSPDVVMDYSDVRDWKNLSKIPVPIAMLCSDPWRDIKWHLPFIKENKISVGFFRHPEVIPVYRKLTGIKLLPLIDSLDKNFFKPLNLEKKYDLMQTGDVGVGKANKKFRYLLFSSYRNRPNCLIKAGHPFNLEEVVRRINQTKIVITGCSTATFGGEVIRCGQRQPQEVMACRVAVATDSPSDLRSRHFIPDVNFISINEKTFKRKLEYYLEEEKARERIAEEGYKTFLKYHTSEKRAKELLRDLKDLAEGK